MKVVLTEKPSVARDIAAVVGANNKKDGYYEGNGFVVTYAFGHLVTLAEPEEMNAAWAPPWRLNQLPMIPEQWKYRVVDKTKNQFNVIKKFFLDPDQILCYYRNILGENPLIYQCDLGCCPNGCCGAGELAQ